MPKHIQQSIFCYTFCETGEKMDVPCKLKIGSNQIRQLGWHVKLAMRLFLSK